MTRELGQAKSLLRRIVGRVTKIMIENRVVILMGVAGFTCPSAIGLFIFLMQAENLDTFTRVGITAVCSIFLMMAIVSWGGALKIVDNQRKKERSLASEIHDLVSEIHDLVEEIRKDGNERNNSDNRKPDNL